MKVWMSRASTWKVSEVVRPQRIGLKEVLRHFLDFRLETVKRRFEPRLRFATVRLSHFWRIDIRHPEFHGGALDLSFEGVAVSHADNATVDDVQVSHHRDFAVADRPMLVLLGLSMTVALPGLRVDVATVLVRSAAMTRSRCLEWPGLISAIRKCKVRRRARGADGPGMRRRPTSM